MACAGRRKGAEAPDAVENPHVRGEDCVWPEGPASCVGKTERHAPFWRVVFFKNGFGHILVHIAQHGVKSAPVGGPDAGIAACGACEYGGRPWLRLICEANIDDLKEGTYTVFNDGTTVLSRRFQVPVVPPTDRS